MISYDFKDRTLISLQHDGHHYCLAARKARSDGAVWGMVYALDGGGLCSRLYTSKMRSGASIELYWYNGELLGAHDAALGDGLIYLSVGDYLVEQIKCPRGFAKFIMGNRHKTREICLASSERFSVFNCPGKSHKKYLVSWADHFCSASLAKEFEKIALESYILFDKQTREVRAFETATSGYYSVAAIAKDELTFAVVWGKHADEVAIFDIDTH